MEDLRSQVEPWFKKSFSIVNHADRDVGIEQGLGFHEMVIQASSILACIAWTISPWQVRNKYASIHKYLSPFINI